MLYEWLVIWPKPVEPSPKDHVYEFMKPSGSTLADPSKVTNSPTTGLVGEKLNLATGGSSGGAVTCNRTLAVCVIPPPEPRTVMVQNNEGVFIDVDTVNVAVAFPFATRIIELGRTVADGGEANPPGITEALRLTVPENPTLLENVTVKLANDPAWMLLKPGLIVTVKSGAGTDSTMTFM